MTLYPNMAINLDEVRVAVMIALLFLLFPIFILAQYTEIQTSFSDVQIETSAWGDYDNDSDLDILVTGLGGGGAEISRIYRNDGGGSFVDIEAGLIGLKNSSLAWGDLDNDADLDILMTGEHYFGDYVCYTNMYRNNGNSTFTLIPTLMPGLTRSSIALGDYDNDGYLDVLQMGLDPQPNGFCSTRIFRNNGNFVFTDIGANLIGLWWGSVAWGDYDNDDDLDILITGSYVDSSYHRISRVYRNNGNSTFTDIAAGLTGVMSGCAAWGDYDNDGDLDIILTGNSGTNPLSKVYRNNGNSTFTYILTAIPGVYDSSVSWGDYDNDGDLDVLLIGISEYPMSISKIFQNNGNANFTEINADFTGLSEGSANWGDYDNDGDLDILLSGFIDDANDNYYAKLYRNNSTSFNSIPSAPTNLRSTIIGDYVKFQWDAANDNQTPQPGLSYVIRIGTTSGSCQISSPQSNSSGYRLIPAMGTTNMNCYHRLLISLIPEGAYWTVQTIDASLSGSAFSEEQEFSSLPKISLLTPLSVSFGSIPITGFSNWSEVTIKNIASVPLTVSSIHFNQIESQYEFVYTGIGTPIQPGDVDSILVRYAPDFLGTAVDTLYVVSDAINSPVVIVKLTGVGAYVPPKPPQNTQININGDNAVLSWEPVTQTIFGTPITPEYYLVFSCPSGPNDTFYFLGATASFQYTHSHVGMISPFTFYMIKAYKHYGRSSIALRYFDSFVGLPEKELSERLGL